MKLTSEQEAIARDATTTLLNYCLSSTPREVIHKLISDAIARAVEQVQAQYAKFVDDHAETHFERDRLREQLRAQSEDTKTGWVLRDEICERVPWDTPSKQAWVRIRYATRKE